MAILNSQTDAALHFIHAKQSPIMMAQKVKHLPHPKAKFSKCYENSYNCVTTDKIVSGYVLQKKTTNDCESGKKHGWAVMPHFWSVDSHSNIAIDRTPYDPEIAKKHGKVKDWIYIVDPDLHDTVEKLWRDDISLAVPFTTFFIQDNGEIYLVKKNLEGPGARFIELPDLEWLTLFEAYYSVGDQ